MLLRSKRAIFLAPKFYCLELEDGRLITKVKGLTKNVPLTFEDFDSLLIKNNELEKSQEKWYKSLEDATISVKDQLYTLKVNSNKPAVPTFCLLRKFRFVYLLRKKVATHTLASLP